MKARKIKQIDKSINLPRLLKEELFKKEIWYASELGIKPSSAHSAYRLNFSTVNPLWFRDIVKKFIHFQSATKAYWTCAS